METILAIIMVLVIASPFILAGKARKNREKNIKISLDELASSNNTSIKDFDLWFGCGIGSNSTLDKLFFVRNLEDANDKVAIDLKEFQQCKLKKDINKAGNLTHMELVFTPKNKSVSEKKIEIFDTEINPQLNGEIQVSEKWLQRLNQEAFA